ncbi:MAG: PstS family phosphate ABC transporter substrate-binding protein [Planctomycetaceae bacterium]|nr:PstS family phosphate ABC transporter substrate-binding protein [Planctomycetaceae bacterium]
MLGLVAACAAIMGCDSSVPSAPSGESLSGKIEIDGSSTVYKLTQAVAQEFNKANSGVAMKVDKSGTSGGFKKFVLGTLDVCDASRPISQKEIDDCKQNNVEYIELPIAFDALTVAVNAENDWCTSLTTDELKKLWEPAPEGKPHPVMTWKDIRPGWPDQKIALFGADRESGTFEYFTEAIVEKKNSCRDDCSQLADDNAIVVGIAGDPAALGYVPYAYYVPRTDKLKAVAIDSTKDQAGPVLPSVEAVNKSTYKPLARPLFIYVNRKAADRPEIKAFVEFYLKIGASMSGKVKYIPLTDVAYTKGAEQFAKLQIGTRFGGGHAVTDQPLDHIMDQEPQP